MNNHHNKEAKQAKIGSYDLVKTASDLYKDSQKLEKEGSLGAALAKAELALALIDEAIKQDEGKTRLQRRQLIKNQISALEKKLHSNINQGNLDKAEELFKRPDIFNVDISETTCTLCNEVINNNPSKEQRKRATQLRDYLQEFKKGADFEDSSLELEEKSNLSEAYECKLKAVNILDPLVKQLEENKENCAALILRAFNMMRCCRNRYIDYVMKNLPKEEQKKIIPLLDAEIPLDNPEAMNHRTKLLLEFPGTSNSDTVESCDMAWKLAKKSKKIYEYLKSPRDIELSDLRIAQACASKAATLTKMNKPRSEVHACHEQGLKQLKMTSDMGLLTSHGALYSYHLYIDQPATAIKYLNRQVQAWPASSDVLTYLMTSLNRVKHAKQIAQQLFIEMMTEAKNGKAVHSSITAFIDRHRTVSNQTSASFFAQILLPAANGPTAPVVRLDR